MNGFIAFAKEVKETVGEEIKEAVSEAIVNGENFFEKIWKASLNFVIDWGPRLLLALVIFFAGWFLVMILVKLIKKILNKTDLDKTAVNFLTLCSKLALRLLVIILALMPFGMNLGTALTALAASGVSLGIGLQGVISNLAAGIQIIVTKPIKTGDYILVDGNEGYVISVQIMFTTLKTQDLKQVVVPNNRITTLSLVNFTTIGSRRIEYNFQLKFDEDINKVRNLLFSMVQGDSMILKEPAPYLAVLSQSNDGINCSFRIYGTPDDYWTLFFKYQEKIVILLHENGIEVPFSQLDVYVKEVQDNDENKKK